MGESLTAHNIPGSVITATSGNSAISLDVSVKGTITESSLTSIGATGSWIDTSTTLLDTAPPSARKSIAIQNTTSGLFYLAGGSPITVASTWILRQWDTIAVDLQSGTSIWGQAAAGSKDIRTMEVA